MINPNSNAGQDFELGAVAENQKRSFWSMFVIMMGFTFFSASMWVGLTLAKGDPNIHFAGLSFGNFILAVMAGNLILGAYTGLLAYPAAKTGLSVHLLSRYSFGTRGSNIPSAILAITQIGWFGVGVAMFAIPATWWLADASFLHGTWLTGGIHERFFGAEKELPLRLLWTLTILSGVVMTSSAYFGIKALHVISVVSVPAIAVLGGWSAIQALFVDSPDFIAANNPSVSAGAIKHGWDVLMQHAPAAGGENVSAAVGMAIAISLGIGSFISGGSCTPDFTRYARNAKIAVSTTVLAFFIGNSLMFFFGGAAAMVYGKNDISNVMFIQGLLLPAVIVLLLNIWTTNDNALYTSGLGLSNITGLPKRFLVLFNGVLGTISAIWLYNHFCDWLHVLNAFIPPCGAILISDYFICARRNYPPMSEKKFSTVSAPAVAAWAAGSLVALFGLMNLDPKMNLFGLPNSFVKAFDFGLPAINGMVVAAVIYIALTATRKRAGANSWRPHAPSGRD